MVGVRLVSDDCQWAADRMGVSTKAFDERMSKGTNAGVLVPKN